MKLEWYVDDTQLDRRITWYRGHVIFTGKSEDEYGKLVDYMGISYNSDVYISLDTNKGTHEIASEWGKKVEVARTKVWGNCYRNAEDVAECVRSVDRLADWLIRELAKVDSTQLEPALRVDIMKLLSGGKRR